MGMREAVTGPGFHVDGKGGRTGAAFRNLDAEMPVLESDGGGACRSPTIFRGELIGLHLLKITAREKAHR